MDIFDGRGWGEVGGGSVWQTNLQILDLQRLASPILVGKIRFYSSLSM